MSDFRNTERAAFIRKICEDPFNDALRLIYADWLEEQGEEMEAVTGRNRRIVLLYSPFSLTPVGLPVTLCARDNH